jgi:hypothetical protein
MNALPSAQLDVTAPQSGRICGSTSRRDPLAVRVLECCDPPAIRLAARVRPSDAALCTETQPIRERDGATQKTGT